MNPLTRYPILSCGLRRGFLEPNDDAPPRIEPNSIFSNALIWPYRASISA